MRKGEAIIVTDRGEPVARVSPATEWEALSQEEKLDEWARQGHIRKGKGGPLPPIKPVPLRGKALSEMISEDRGTV